MGKREIMYKGKKWNSSEGVFISMRFDDEEIIEELRKNDNGGMRVKMISKKYALLRSYGKEIPVNNLSKKKTVIFKIN